MDEKPWIADGKWTGAGKASVAHFAKVYDERCVREGVPVVGQFAKPSKEFKDANGLKGDLHREYRFPEGTPALEVEKALVVVARGGVGDAWQKRMVGQLWPFMQGANALPQKENWTDYQRLDALCGMISQFNLSDIEYYNDTPKERRDPRHAVECARLAKSRGMEWIPSPQTLGVMRGQLNSGPDID
jgi:hypothetical protein